MPVAWPQRKQRSTCQGSGVALSRYTTVDIGHLRYSRVVELQPCEWQRAMYQRPPNPPLQRTIGAGIIENRMGLAPLATERPC